MEYVYRTVGLVRGAHPYGFVVDDLKKDSASHLYQWTAMLNGSVVKASYESLKPGQIVLCHRSEDSKSKPASNLPPPIPVAGEPLLLVCPLGLDAANSPDVLIEPGPLDRNGTKSPYDRLVIDHRGVEAHYRVLLIPIRTGDPVPDITFDAASGQAAVKWPAVTDLISFSQGPDARSKVSVTRAGQKVIESR